MKLYLKHGPNTTGLDLSEMLTYWPLTNNAVLGKISVKVFIIYLFIKIN